VSSESELLGQRIYQAIQDASNFSARTLQGSQEFRVGVSDLGFCSERVRRVLDHQVPDETDSLEAFIGTAIGDHVEQAYLAQFPDAIVQSEVEIELHGESGRTYRITGHPDLIHEDKLVDVKTVFGLEVVKRSGPSLSQQFQRHCYAKAAHEAGLFGDLPLEDVQVANVWIDRSGKTKEAHVHMEPYSEEVVDHAGQWLDDVVYAYIQQEEARKEPPRELCQNYCGFYTVCRAYDTDVEGLIRAPETLGAIDLYREGMELEKRGRQLKKEASVHLEGVQGSTGEVTVRWVHVNESTVPSFTRQAYDKLDVRRIPKPKAKPRT